MLSLLKNTVSSLYANVSAKLQSIFVRSNIDTETLKELEQLLLEADTGMRTTKMILSELSNQYSKGSIKNGAELQEALNKQLVQLLTSTKSFPENPSVFLMVGINGSGKTTFISKLAHHFSNQGKKVLLVAADTFRAAATEQLSAWAERTHTKIVTGTPQQDPASVVFAGCETFKKEAFDIVLIDTAGRLQTKVNLMRELEKIKRIINKQLPNAHVATLLTIDAMLGQNSFQQAKIFHESTQVDGIVLTKMDGTAKGGTVFAIAHEFGIPIAYVSFGESMEQFKKFDAQEFVDGLLSQAR
jgi:fused signal recognition particle receptor